ncbi:MAG TPA: Flp pilus assembly protein CpaB [Symbiobacteriaceae bacterium]|nr:Flp pilus assembly protein CpaB [Symbiobacteriaceae bacterium]
MRGLEAIRHSGAGLFFFGAVLLALLAGLTVYSYLASSVPSVEVVVVNRDLPPGASLVASDLSVRKVPSSALPGESLQSLKEAEGKRIRFGLAAGDYLRKQHLVQDASGDVSGKVTSLGEEYRAVSLPGELVPAFDRLLPGDRLELTGVLPVQDSRTNSSVAVSLGVATVLDVQAAKGQTDKSAVLVAMRDAEVPKLALTLRVGALTVAVQGSGEKASPVAALRLETLTGAGQAVPVPATPPRP